MVSILEDIARNGGDTARIQAIKALRAMSDGPEEAPADEWTEIYGHDNVTSIAAARKRAG